jgi:hypothetical protein
MTATGERFRVDTDSLIRTLEDRWTPHFPLSRLASVAVITALPGAFLTFVRNHPDSWAARHQTKVANALHVLALATVANQRVSVQDLLVTALVMVSFEALQRSLEQGSDRAKAESSAIETLLSSTHTIVAESDIVVPAREKNGRVDSGVHGKVSAAKSEKEEAINSRREKLKEVETANETKENDLRRSRDDLCKTRDTLNATLAENASLRDETKVVKQSVGRDHQAIIYRKDIELFALRKGNEQKEIQIKEKDTMLADLHRQHKAAMDLKEAQVQSLKEKIATFEEPGNDEVDDEANIEQDGHHEPAMRVKLLRVQGRSSHEHDRLLKEKDLEIARLREDLSAIMCGSETLTRVQDELRRAWDSTYEMQRALNEERHAHTQSKHKLQEAALRLEEEVRKSEKSSPVRLPTIEESDKNELEVMFNAAQQDNIRLHSEHEVVEKRLREANARLFTSEQEMATLKEQLRLEKAINEDMETARPSVVHRAHFQRMEGQLQESRDALNAKDSEIEQLKSAATKKENELQSLQKETEAAARSQSQLQEEVDGLKRSVTQLESTKEQLMLDHERLAQHRARQRTSTGTADHTSARSSGATLITEPVHVYTDAETPLPTRPATIATDFSVHSTPETNTAVDTPVTPTPIDRKPNANRFSLITNDVPPPELRSSRRRSLNLKGLMRKMTGKETGDKEKARPMTGYKESKKEKEREKEQRPKTALAPKDKNAPLRPQTSAAAQPSARGKEITSDAKPPMPPLPALTKDKDLEAMLSRPATAAASVRDKGKENEKAERPRTARYYSESRPQSAIEAKEERDKAVNGLGVAAEGNGRPKSRGWGGSVS